jgi:hydrogenase nickel incorporation protein HypA/HybF
VHELSIVLAILDEAAAQAERHGAARITRIKIRVGRLRQVDPTLLAEAFELARHGTLAADATLDASYFGMELACNACSLKTELETWAFECPECGSPDVRLSGGDELELTSMDLEVPDGHSGPEEEHPGPERPGCGTDTAAS